jgi:hypothetical protein
MSLVYSRTWGEHAGRGKSRVLVIFTNRAYSMYEEKDVLNAKKNSKDGNKGNKEKITLEVKDEGERGWNVYKFK